MIQQKPLTQPDQPIQQAKTELLLQAIEVLEEARTNAILKDFKKECDEAEDIDWDNLPPE